MFSKSSLVESDAVLPRFCTLSAADSCCAAACSLRAALPRTVACILVAAAASASASREASFAARAGAVPRGFFVSTLITTSPVLTALMALAASAWVATDAPLIERMMSPCTSTSLAAVPGWISPTRGWPSSPS